MTCTDVVLGTYNLLSKPDTRYRDLGSSYHESRLNKQHRQCELIRQLEHLAGQKVTFDPKPNPAQAA